MHDTLDRAIGLALTSEGGYTDHPKDPGGPTNMGVTRATYSAWLKRTATIDDLKALTTATATEIFIKQYALPIRYNDLPAGLDYAILDCSINSGPGRAGVILQTMLGMKGRDLDGIIGSRTLALLAGRDVGNMIAEYDAARLVFMRKLKIWNTFGTGWTNRVTQVGFQALALALNEPLPIGQLSIAAQAKATGATRLLSSVNGKATVGAVATGAIFAGGVANQVANVLSPFSTSKYVAYALIACTVASSAVPLWIAIKRASDGEVAA